MTAWGTPPRGKACLCASVSGRSSSIHRSSVRGSRVAGCWTYMTCCSTTTLTFLCIAPSATFPFLRPFMVVERQCRAEPAQLVMIVKRRQAGGLGWVGGGRAQSTRTSRMPSSTRHANSSSLHDPRNFVAGSKQPSRRCAQVQRRHSGCWRETQAGSRGKKRIGRTGCKGKCELTSTNMVCVPCHRRAYK